MKTQFAYSTNFENVSKDFPAKLLNEFKKIVDDKAFGFFQLENRNLWVKQCQDIHQKFPHIKNFVHVGIGGSSLGPEMLVKALKPTDCKVSFYFLNNLDPDYLYDLLDDLNLEESLFYFVSKSGSTAETLSLLSVIWNQLESYGGKELCQKNIVCASECNNSDLHLIAKENELCHLELASNIGGRFSVLTPVGLLPMQFAGVNLDRFFTHWEQVTTSLATNEQSDLVKLAHCLYMEKKNNQVNQTVIMPYSSKLQSFSNWFVQLWAESLGKVKSEQGSTVNEGLTPIAAYGVTDQHSQMQLFREGPRDKFILFIEVEEFNCSYSLENQLGTKNTNMLKNSTLEGLLKAELKGTLKSLKDDQRSYAVLKIQQLNPETLSYLILFLESLTVSLGILLEVDPFNQPGVEAAKVYAKEFLEKSS